MRLRSIPLVANESRLVGWAITIGLFAVALWMRLVQLGQPHSFEFDETYYAKDSWSLIHHGFVLGYADNANAQILAGHWTPALWQHDPSMIVHPEVGKYLIGLGELAFGFNPFGWRIAAAIVGSLMVAVMVRLGRRLTGSNLLGGVAGTILCLDGLQLVLSRLGLLDIFQAFFMLAAISCLVADRDWGRSRLTELGSSSWGPRLLWRPWRLAAGVMFGLSVATKWSTIYPIAAFGLLVWAWDTGARRRLGVRRAWWRAAVVDELPAVAYLVLLPALIYVLSWTGWMIHAADYERALGNNGYHDFGGYIRKPWPHGFAAVLRSLHDLWEYHRAVWAFHTGGLNTSTHIYQSKPLGWLVLQRPVGVDAQLNIQPGDQGCTAIGSTCLRQVLLLGNPAVWWGGCAALLYAAYAWIARRDWRFGIVVVGVLCTWLPWLQYDKRPIFLYYAINILPFVVLGTTLLLGRVLGPREASVTRRRIGAAAAGVYVLVVLALFGWFWPIWTDQVISQSGWIQRIWFKSWI